MQVLQPRAKRQINPQVMKHKLQLHAREGQRIRLIVASSLEKNVRMQDRVSKLRLQPKRAKTVIEVQKTRQNNQEMERKLTLKTVLISLQLSKNANE